MPQTTTTMRELGVKGRSHEYTASLERLRDALDQDFHPDNLVQHSRKLSKLVLVQRLP